MAWYYIILIIVGCITAMYFTGLLVYVNQAKDCDGVNLLTCKEETVETERGELNVQGSLDNLTIFSVFAGIFFPITWTIVILGYIIKFLSMIVSPITNCIINKNKKFKNENN